MEEKMQGRGGGDVTMEAEIWRNGARWWLPVCVNSAGPQDPDIWSSIILGISWGYFEWD